MTTPTRRTTDRNTNLPLYSLGTAIILLVLAIVAVTLIDQEHDTPYLATIIGLIATTVPSLIAAAFAERVSRDVRNGVLEDKVTEGATRALDNTGVTHVVNNVARTQPLYVDALAALLARGEASANRAEESAARSEASAVTSKEGNTDG